LNKFNPRDEENEKIHLPTSVLIHCLICLSYLSKERFAHAIESTDFIEKISIFVEEFSLSYVGEVD